MTDKGKVMRRDSGTSEIILKNKLFGKIKGHERMFANTYLGIDIGLSDVRYVYLYRMKNKFEIISYGIEKFPDMDVDRTKSIQLALKNLFIKRKIKATQVVLSVYGPEISTRILDMPDMPEKDLRSAIQLQNRNEIVYFDDDTVWDYEILKKDNSNGKGTIKVLVIVAHNEAMLQYVDALAQMNIKPSLIIPKPKAHEASYKRFVPHKGQDLLIDIGNESVMFCFFNKGKVWYVPNVALGSNNLRKGLEKEIARNEKLVLKKLEDMGRKPVLNDKIKEKILQISINANPVLEILLGEIKKTVEYIKSEFGFEKLGNVYLCGNGSLIEGIQDKIKDLTRMPVHLIFPIFKPAYKVSDYIDFVSPFGAALYLSDNFNMIPSQSRESWRFNYYQRWAYFAGLILIIILSILSMQQIRKLQEAKTMYKAEIAKFEKINPKIIEHAKDEEKLKETWNEYKELLKKSGRDYFPQASLGVIGESLPSGIVIYEMIFESVEQIKKTDKPTKRISLKGRTYKNEHLWETMLPSFIESLRKSGIFNRVSLIHQEFSQEENRGVFTLDLTMNGNENEKKSDK